MKRLLLILGLLGAIAVIGAGFVWQRVFSSASSSAEDVKFTIKKGDSLTSVATRLEEEGIILSSWSLRILAKLEDKPTILQPGLFTLSAAMAPQQILDTILTESRTLRVTIPEGWRREEIAERFAEYLPESFDQDEFIRLTEGREGMLFPDTYDVQRDFTAETVVSLLRNTFDRRYKEAVAGKTTDRLQDEIVILASLVEREAKTAESRRIVAGILLNRLRLGMPLQVDATLQYAKGKNATGEWWAIPRGADKDIDSPFNTYKNTGLPPGPICNPGIDAVKAAIEPTQTEYLYYISDSAGGMHYAVDYDTHLENIEKYLR